MTKLKKMTKAKLAEKLEEIDPVFMNDGYGYECRWCGGYENHNFVGGFKHGDECLVENEERAFISKPGDPPRMNSTSIIVFQEPPSKD